MSYNCKKAVCMCEITSTYWKLHMNLIIKGNFALMTAFVAFVCCYAISHCSFFGHLHFTKNKTVCSKFGRPISNESRGQTNQLFDLKIQIYYTHFSSIFAVVVKSSAFCTLLLLFQRVEVLKLQFDEKT